MAASRDGNYLVISRATSTLPNFCIKCGEPGVKTIRKSFQWHPPLLYLLIFLTPIVYVIFAAPFCRKMSLAVSLCRGHARRRLFLLVLGTLLTLGSIPLGIVLEGNAGLSVGIFGTLGGLILLVVAANLARPVKMSDSEATFTGMGEMFLRRFPGK